MGAGRIIAIIGGIVGILSIVLYYAMPGFFCLWRFDGGAALTIFAGGFGSTSGTLVGIDYGPDSAEDMLFLIVAILIIAGGVLALIGGIAENKALGIIGGILMLAGPGLLVVELFLELGFWEGFPEFALWGSQAGANWGVWIGFFMAIGGGVLGIIGGATSD
ncbi:MAG: hypothetical protein ACFFA3_00945 [Promethearchaeota archaeon]